MKNCLATLGLIFLFFLSAAAVLALPLFADEIFSLTGSFGYPVDIRTSSGSSLAVDTYVSSGSAPVMTNLVETQPTALPTLTPTPEPTPTQVPDPVDYRARVMMRARVFSTALNNFMDTSNKLQSQPDLMGDPAWRVEVRAALDEFVSSTEDLSRAGSVPEEYQAVQAWLEAAGSEANSLRYNYLAGVETGDHSRFQAAGENMNRLVDTMQQAELAMIAAGWEQ